MIKHLLQRLIRSIDPWLLLFTLLVFAYSVLVLYSASNRDLDKVLSKFVHLLIACGVMWLISNIPQQTLMRLAPVI